MTLPASPDTDGVASQSLSAARLLSALDTHGPKVAVYLIVA